MDRGAQAAVAAALEAGLLEAAPHWAVLYDLQQVDESIGALKAAFPQDTLHALALKACPITELVRHAAGLGCGAEAASLPELEQALRVGVPPAMIVFDSPAKTVEELRYALGLGVHVNADSLQELDRIAHSCSDRIGAETSIGVRVNPGLRPGSIRATSTAYPGSKFGVSLADDEAELLERFERYPWLTGLHVHIGSQGCDLELLTEGVARGVEIAAEVEGRLGKGRIQTFDLGGGLPVGYRFGESQTGFAEYVEALEARAPRLFSGEWRLITEPGRAVWARTAVAISRVEYTKVSHGRRIAVVHLGADMLLRTAYAPETWFHEITVFDAAGRSKKEPVIEQDVAGPLCFSGDLLARARRLPLIEPGDWVVVHDVGAYTLGMWSRYNSRVSPPVYGLTPGSTELETLRAGETAAGVLSFWD